MGRVNLKPFVVPVYDGPTKPVKNPRVTIAKMRASEAALDAQATLEQKLSHRLAQTYSRNIFCALGMLPNSIAFELPDGRVATVYATPTARLLREDDYIQCKCSHDMALRLLRRDEIAEAA